MSDLEVLTDFLGVVEYLERGLDDYVTTHETHRKMKSMVQGWIDQVIDMIDEHEEME